MDSESMEKPQLLHDFHLVDDLTSDVKLRFPFHAQIRDSLNYCGHRILTNEKLTLAGRHLLCLELTRKHENVKSVLNYLASSPTQSKEKINEVPMIVICGLPRTGTTLLHNLMACDPACRAPLVSDMTIHPIPPIPRSNTSEHKRRMDAETHSQEQVFQIVKRDMQQYANNRSSTHADFEWEEDTALHDEVGVQCLYCILAPKHTNLLLWYTDTKNKDFAYAYHQAVLQMLHDVDPPRTHWQLKSPTHSLWIDSLLEYYPKASLIMSHRRLDEVVPSACSCFLTYNSIYFDENDLQSLKFMVERTVVLLDFWIQRIVEFRTRKPSPNNIFDIQYKDLMKDPLDTVRRIYNHFDFLQWSDEFERKMRIWLAANPHGKQGRHSYSLDQFGLVQNNTKEMYKKYEQMFISD